ncbi:hypothetical protein MIR68_004184 [Amoeboaphelidium protococcarum]|nr:hypothetical protein MIR68_004184 [Amoeboaphelidium protococcarum]
MNAFGNSSFIVPQQNTTLPVQNITVPTQNTTSPVQRNRDNDTDDEGIQFPYWILYIFGVIFLILLFRYLHFQRLLCMRRESRQRRRRGGENTSQSMTQVQSTAGNRNNNNNNNNNNASSSSRYGRQVFDSDEIDLTQVSAADDPDYRTATLPKYSITPPPEHTTIVVQPPPYSPSQPEP